MVFFVCEGCNESLKKNQVDKHAQRCSSCYAVTCVDCSKTFHGDDYAAHVTCISEAEKYEKSVYKPKKEKLNPQDLWVQALQNAANSAHTAPENIRPYISHVAESPNVPRNKNKFINFARNSLRIHSTAILESLWSFFEGFKNPPTTTQQKNSTDSTKTDNTVSSESKASKEEKESKKPDVEVTTPKTDVEDGKKKKKSKKNKSAAVEAEAENAVNASDVSKKKKKKKTVEVGDKDAAPVTPVLDSETPKKKSKKRKQSEEIEASNSQTNNSDTKNSESLEPAKKKKKSKKKLEK